MSFKSLIITIASLLSLSMRGDGQGLGINVLCCQMQTEECSLETKLMWSA